VQAVRAAQGWVGDGDWVDRESLDEHGGKISRAEDRKFGWDIWPDESERWDGKVMPDGERSGDQGCRKGRWRSSRMNYTDAGKSRGCGPRLPLPPRC
jgi:hypothetical protein